MIPVPAVGRAQEMMLVLDKEMRERNFSYGFSSLVRAVEFSIEFDEDLQMVDAYDSQLKYVF